MKFPRVIVFGGYFEPVENVVEDDFHYNSMMLVRDKLRYVGSFATH